MNGTKFFFGNEKYMNLGYGFAELNKISHQHDHILVPSIVLNQENEICKVMRISSDFCNYETNPMTISFENTSEIECLPISVVFSCKSDFSFLQK